MRSRPRKRRWRRREYAGPVILRLPAVGSAYPVLYTDDLTYEIGKALCVHEGEDVAILATGIMVHDALVAAERLEKSGIGARVLDIHTIKPLDERAVLAAARETGAIVTVEEANVLGGLGGAVAELTAEKCPIWIKRVGVKDVFGESGTAEEILEYCGLTASGYPEGRPRGLESEEGEHRHQDGQDSSPMRRTVPAMQRGGGIFGGRITVPQSGHSGFGKGDRTGGGSRESG